MASAAITVAATRLAALTRGTQGTLGGCVWASALAESRRRHRRRRKAVGGCDPGSLRSTAPSRPYRLFHHRVNPPGDPGKSLGKRLGEYLRRRDGVERARTLADGSLVVVKTNRCWTTPRGGLRDDAGHRLREPG